MLHEKDLLTQLKEGDVKAFDEIYWKNHGALYANILKIIKDTVATEDLLQEVFIALWQNKESLDVDKPVANWLFVVSFNKSISYLKKTLKENLENSNLAALSISNNDFHHNYSDAQWNILQSGLQQLSPQKRRAFQLCKLESKTYKEAAEEMHISKHTVKQYLQDSMADEEYLKVYHLPALEGKFNTSEGIALANKYNELSDKIMKYTMDYVHDNPKSIVAFDRAYYMLEGYTTTLSIPQIDDLVKTISPVWKGTYNLDVFMDASKNSRKTA
ncbi:MAG: sigma-70 family RNA polymerase sigma factor, partial [Ginsengibacter sp.]